MLEKTIYELPIYSIKEKEFKKRWKEKRLKLRKEAFKNYANDDDAYREIDDIYYPSYIWKYNQIIGSLKISVTKQDVLFTIYCSRAERFFAFSKVKHYIVDSQANGTHFNVQGKTNESIKLEIKDWLKYIKKVHLRRNFFVDESTIENTLNYIEIRKIIDNIDAN
jgi:hypothetical protein